MPSLANLDDLRTVLGQLNAERPDGVEPRPDQTLYEQREGDFFKRLDLEVTSRQGKARILVTGQIGVGKSSELRHYFHATKRDPRRGFYVLCDLEKEEHPERCGATGVLLTILRDSWSAARSFQEARSLESIREDILSRMIDWLKGEYTDNKEAVTFRFGGMAFLVSLEPRARDAALALVLGKAAQHEAVSQPSERFGLAPDSLLGLLNKLLQQFAISTNGRPRILIVDHVDKIRDPAAAEDVLLKAFPHWNRIAASIIMTAPFEYTLGELGNSVESKWGHPQMLYPVEIPGLETGEIPAMYRNIVKHCGLAGMMEEGGLRLLAHYSGGILRLFVQFLIQACKEAHFASHARVMTSDAEAVISQAGRGYQDYTADDLNLLEEIDSRGTGLRQAAILLRSPIGLLVCAPRAGEAQLRVHPLARAALERFRLRTQVAPK
jgi:hypothetical protein